MLYYSTANPRHKVSLLEAVGRGLPPDGGVYMPERLPYIPKAFFNNMADMSLKDIGYVVANTLFGEDIAAADLKQIVAEAINFDTPLIPDPDHSGMYALELFHGPSGSYKDFGARFMAHTLRRIHRPDSGSTSSWPPRAMQARPWPTHFSGCRAHGFSSSIPTQAPACGSFRRLPLSEAT